MNMIRREELHLMGGMPIPWYEYEGLAVYRFNLHRPKVGAITDITLWGVCSIVHGVPSRWSPTRGFMRPCNAIDIFSTRRVARDVIRYRSTHSLRGCHLLT